MQPRRWVVNNGVFLELEPAEQTAHRLGVPLHAQDWDSISSNAFAWSEPYRVAMGGPKHPQRKWIVNEEVFWGDRELAEKAARALGVPLFTQDWQTCGLGPGYVASGEPYEVELDAEDTENATEEQRDKIERRKKSTEEVVSPTVQEKLSGAPIHTAECGARNFGNRQPPVPCICGAVPVMPSVMFSDPDDGASMPSADKIEFAAGGVSEFSGPPDEAFEDEAARADFYKLELQNSDKHLDQLAIALDTMKLRQDVLTVERDKLKEKSAEQTRTALPLVIELDEAKDEVAAMRKEAEETEESLQGLWGCVGKLIEIKRSRFKKIEYDRVTRDGIPYD